MKRTLCASAVLFGLLLCLAQTSATSPNALGWVTMTLNVPQAKKMKDAKPNDLVPILLDDVQWKKVKGVFPSIVGKTAKIKKIHMRPGQKIRLKQLGDQLVSVP